MSSLDIALADTARGWYVFPVIPGTKRPAVKWHDAATTDAEQVATWFTGDHADSLVGIHTGKSGLVVVDVDRKNGKDGDAALRAAGINPDDHDTLTMQTPSGGYHLYYTAPEGAELTVAQNHPVEAVDIRSGVGYVVAYEVPPVGTALAPAPEWSLKRAGEHIADSNADATLSAWLDRAGTGKPSKSVTAARDAVTPEGMGHDAMLAAVTGLIQLGNEPGSRDAYLAARETYTANYPDHAEQWDAAAAGSVRRLGLPPVTLDIPKPERKAIKERNDPKAVAQVDVDRKRALRIAYHNAALEPVDRPNPGSRILEDGPLAAELASAFTGRWAYHKDWGALRYNGVIWQPVEHLHLVEAVRTELSQVEIAEHQHAVLRGAPAPELNKVRTLLSRNRARAVAELVTGILASHDIELDADPDILNVLNGVVDLATKELRPHDWRDYCTKVAGCDYDPNADDTDWNKALEAFPADSLEWIKVKFGQSATGHMAEDAEVPFLQGGGANGKSAVLNGIRAALGDYAVTVPDKVLLANANDHPTELTTLLGARLAITEELPEGRTLNTKRLKDIAGTPVITARRMRQDFISWQATHTLFVSTNHTPVVVETDHGTWRRLVLVKFPWRFRGPGQKLKTSYDRRADPGLRDRLGKVAHPAVLKWIVDGAAAWYANGQAMPKHPKRIKNDTRAWRHDADPVMQFADERLERDADSAIWVRDMLNEFNAWQTEQGIQQWSARTLVSRFAGHESLPGVAKKVVRFGRVTLSRPTFQGMTPMNGPTSDRAEAWVGVRFKSDETAARSGNVTPMRRSARSEGDKEA